MPKKPSTSKKGLVRQRISQEFLWEYGRKIPPVPKNLPDPQLTPTGEYIAKNNYLQRDLEGKIVETPKEMFWRVAHNVATADLLYGGESQMKKTRDEFYQILSSLEFVPNTPTFANAAGKLQQLSACFVLPVEDSLESIGQTFMDTIMIHKTGGGTGFSFSKVRPYGSIVRSTGREASGAVYFMWMYADATDRIQQGGYRRGANMGVMSVDHPDILRWITIKSSEFTVNSFNLSVGITKKFMEQVEKDSQFAPEGLAPQSSPVSRIIAEIQHLLENSALNFNEKVKAFEKWVGELKELVVATQAGEGYDLVNPDTQKSECRLNARKVFELIGRVAWEKGDPGVVFLDQINEDNPTPHLGKIEATNPCIVGSTLVATEEGLIPIKELVDKKMEIKILTDDRVIGGIKGVTLRPHNHLWDNGVKEVWRLETESGFELLATPDHKIMTKGGWVPLSELKPDKDKVLIQNGEGAFNQSKNLPFRPQNIFKGKNGKIYKLNLPKYWSRQLGQVLGWLVGDGWLRIGDKNCRVGFSFGEEDKKIMEYLREIINHWYGEEIKPVKRGNGTWHLSYHSKYFGEFFEKLGIKPVKAPHKEVPVSLFTAPKEAVIGFLQGLFSADGTVNYRRGFSSYVRLTAKSKKLLQQVQLLLLNLGIPSRIYNRSRKPRMTFPYTNKSGQVKTYLCDGVCFELEVSRQPVLRFLGEVGFLENKHQKKIQKFAEKSYYEANYWDGVAKIKPHGRENVFDITEPTTYSMIANGIVVADCGEQPLLSYESCNLGAVNLSRMVKEKRDGRGEIDWEKIKDIVHQAVHFLDNVIDMNRYPLSQIEKITKGNRKIGLGIMGWADLLVQLGIPYDSEQALETASQLMSFIREEARRASVELAKKRGVFPNFKGSIYDKKGRWFKGLNLRLRNAALTTIAPTGTTSMLADASSGIEPYFAIRFEKNIITGERVVNLNRWFVNKAKERGFWSKDLVEKIFKNKGSLKGLKEIPEDVQQLFPVAADLPWEAHVKMQAAFQKGGVDNAVSKTINMPFEATPEDVVKSYLLAHQLGCKGITIYRDRSRKKQILERDSPIEGNTLYLRELPEVRQGGTWGVATPVGTLHATINEDKQGNPLETFFNVGKAGGDILAMAEGLGRLISLALRTTPSDLARQKLKIIIEQLSGIGGSSSVGFGGAKIRSLPDGIAKALQKYLEEKSGKAAPSQKKNNSYGDICPECGNATLIYEEGCEKCICGYTKC